MTNAEILATFRAEIERRIALFSSLSENTVNPNRIDEDRQLLSFLDTIESEKPMQEGLEEELDKFIASGKSVTVEDCGTYKVSYHDFKKVASHFYELGLQGKEQPLCEDFDLESDRFFRKLPLRANTPPIPDEYIDEETFDRIARHFAEWGYLRAAEKYDEIEYNRQRVEESVPNDLEEAAMNYIAPIENEDGLWVINFSGQDIKDAFIAGAKWQAEQDQETIELAEDHAYLAGAVNEREKMMKEAVEVRVQTSPLNGPLGISAYCCNFPSKHPFYHCKEGDKVRIIIVKEDGK